MKKNFSAAGVFAGLVILAGLAGVQPAAAQKRGTATASSVIVDTGDSIAGLSVTVSTASSVLISSSGFNAERLWRTRTFQVTASPYTVWMSTYAGTYGSGSGWYVLGSTGSYTTRSQAAIYGILDPSAGSGTAIIKGPMEYQSGEVPRN